ncbi:MAG: HDOD domain-containing protein [Gammaproteobacteria bacterium]|nr:HDOD domain-containing protein [Gammaproteobacteria bacterium]
MSDIYVGRQPIYNTSLGVYGYELLFRTGVQNAALMDSVTAEGASSTTILNSFFEIGLDRLVGKGQAFINLGEQLLLEENSLPMSPEQVVLEVLEDVPVTPQLVEAIKRLSKQGFSIALDDYIYNPAHKPLVANADFIKLDIKALSEKELLKHVKILKKYKTRLLAEKIETIDEFEFCQDLGFDFFQGYFLSRPRIIKSASLPSSRMAVLNLLSVLQNPDAETQEIEAAISFDVAMSYKILKLINSALFNFRNEIESIRQAIVILGRQQLRSWASMLALSKMDDRPSEMIQLAMTRAKMCELLADKAGIRPVDSFFTVGLFSALDILMERNIADLIGPLPLSQDVVAALLRREGVMGDALNCVLAYEVSDFDRANFRSMDAGQLFQAQLAAVEWAEQVVTSL